MTPGINEGTSTNQAAAETNKSVRLLQEPRARGLWVDAWHRLARNRMALVGLFIIFAIILLALFGNSISPYGPNNGGVRHSLASYAAGTWCACWRLLHGRRQG